MNKKDFLNPYESPSSICISLDMAGIVCGSGTPGDDVPWDPNDPQEGDFFDEHLFDVSDDYLY